MMPSSPADRRFVSTAQAFEPRRRGERSLLALVAAAVLGVGAVATLLPTSEPPGQAPAGGEAALLLGVVTGAIVATALVRRADAWGATRWTAGGLTAALAVQSGGALYGALTGEPRVREVLAATFAVLLITFLGNLAFEFSVHIRRDRVHLLLDVALVGVVSGAAVYLLLRAAGAEQEAVLGYGMTAVLAAAAVLLVAGWGVLALWCPTAVHLYLMLCASALAAAGIGLAHVQLFDLGGAPLLAIEVVAAVAVLAFSGVMVVEPRINSPEPAAPTAGRWMRVALLTLSMAGTALIVVAAVTSSHSELRTLEGAVLVTAVVGFVGLRTIVSQVEMARTALEAATALRDREAALASVRAASAVVAESEARHRLLLQSAGDGIVELDEEGTILRTNEAFCAMVGMAQDELIGSKWDALPQRVPGGDSLAGLPETGQAVLARNGATSYLEARASRLAIAPPGTLLLIRDVTASKASEQTIRALLQFLQDRDEDRTRLLKRTNAAIEAERNRIARDLHDGPIQGVSATALSIEAARLLIDRGDVARASRMLQEISDELDEEAVNLRRIMSDLRPPVLEERGLIPAVRDLCSRLQREMGIPVEVEASTGFVVPPGVETLAYRVIQESLSNVSKHAEASRVTIRIAVGAGMVEVEVHDDGKGFDPTAMREFLAAGKVGLASMRERSELAGGTFSIHSKPGSGTRVLAVIPFDILGTRA